MVLNCTHKNLSRLLYEQLYDCNIRVWNVSDLIYLPDKLNKNIKTIKDLELEYLFDFFII